MLFRSNTDTCLDNMQNEDSASYTLGQYACHNFMASAQFFSFSKKYELRREDSCAQVAAPFPQRLEKVEMASCHGQGGEQDWAHTKEGKIIHKETKKCLDAAAKGVRVVDEAWLQERLDNGGFHPGSKATGGKAKAKAKAAPKAAAAPPTSPLRPGYNLHQPLQNTFCITGTLARPRADIENEIKGFTTLAPARGCDDCRTRPQSQKFGNQVPEMMHANTRDYSSP